MATPSEAAKRIGSVVRLFQKKTGLTNADGLDTAVADILADLMHLSKAKKISFAKCLSRAELHFKDECYESQRRR